MWKSQSKARGFERLSGAEKRDIKDREKREAATTAIPNSVVDATESEEAGC